VDDVPLGSRELGGGGVHPARSRPYLPLLESGVTGRAQLAEVERELKAQIERARSAGIRISHFDSHMATLFRSAPLFEVYRRLGAENKMPLLLERLGERGGESSPWTTGAAGEALLDRVVSMEAGVARGDWPKAYEKMLAPLPPGVYQLIVHLAYDDEEMRGATADHPDWGATWRQSDFDLVRSPAFRDFLRAQGFVLVSWKDLGLPR